MKKFLLAMNIASAAHAAQKRSSGAPYIVHCLAVADRLHKALSAAFADVYPHQDQHDLFAHTMLLDQGPIGPIGCDYWSLMSVALTHDVAEDQPEWTPQLDKLGEVVVAMCGQLRNASCDLPKKTPRAVKKRADLDAIDRNMGVFAALVKAADRLDNCESAIFDWAPERCREYGGWSVELRNILASKFAHCRDPLAKATWRHLDAELEPAIQRMLADQ